MSLRPFLQCQRFGELDHLAFGKAELGSSGTRVDVNLDLVELPASRSIQAPAVDQSQTGELSFLAEIDILAHGEVQQQRLFLEDDSDAIEIGVTRASQENRRAI